MEKRYTYHVISNTHWDREWRFSFQKNRQYLVDMIDSVLEILDREPEYRAYHLDSQTIVLNDYLQIRPQNEDKIKRYVREGRLLIGPWYILPDEFLVGGENLIRNLLIGHRIAHRFGHVMKVGYSPFSWGQISQLPQIYGGFGIDVIMFYRGINSLESPKAEFIWEGPDGTRALGSRFSTMPRYNFYFYIYRPVAHNEQIADVVYDWQKGGIPIHPADAALHEEDYSLLESVDEYHEEYLPQAVQSIIDKQLDDFTTSHIFWAEGHDTSGPDIKTVRLIKDINKVLTNGRSVHSTLEEYVAGLKAEVQWDQLPVVRGERRSSQFDRRSTNLYGYVTSTRIYLKQINAECEKWLQSYAEPFYQWAGIMGMDRSTQYLNLAWDLLVQNSAHDSIGGCSLDEIHDDMMNRYKQILEISHGVFMRAWKYLVRQIDLSAYAPDALFLTVINPNSFEREEIVEIYIDIPATMDLGSAQLRSMDGAYLETQLMATESVEPVLEQLVDRPMYFKMQRYRMLAKTTKLPAFGYSVVQILPVSPDETAPSLSPIGRIENDNMMLENDFITVTIHANGTFSLFDKIKDHTYSELGWFYDEGENGHAWVHTSVPPVFDTRGLTPRRSWSLNGPLAAVCRIEYEWMLPATLSDRQQTEGQKVRLPLVVTLSLKKAAKRVELDIELENRSENHRLRIMFPYGLAATHSWAEGQFNVVARPVDRPDTREWVEQPMADFPFDHFVDLQDGKKGMALISQGLKEYEVMNDEKRTLALTLLRAFTFTIQPSSFQDYSHQKGSQCLGRYSYRMALYPHKGDWLKGKVYTQALNFNREIRVMQNGRSIGKLPANLSFLKIEPEQLILSCIKEPENTAQGTIILRLFNPTDQAVNGAIQTCLPVERVEKLTLEELFISKIDVEDQRIPIHLGAKQIATYRLSFKAFHS